MRRGRILILLVLIVIVGLGLAYFDFGGQLLGGGGGGPSVEAPQVVSKKVYYAAQNIPQGTKITEDMLGQNLGRICAKASAERRNRKNGADADSSFPGGAS